MTPTDDQDAAGGLVQRVEVLLSSLTAVVSARVIIDEEKGPQVHIIATDELPVSDVSHAVISALTWGLGFDVPSSQITVVQSTLSRDELKALLASQAADPPPAAVEPEMGDPPPTPVKPTAADAPPEPVQPETADPPHTPVEPTAAGAPPEPVQPEMADPPPTPVEPTAAEAPPEPVQSEKADRPPEPVAPESPSLRRPDATRLVPDTGLVEFSIGGEHGDMTSRSELDLRRLQLEDLQLDKNAQGGFAISVRLADSDRSIAAQRDAGGTEQDLLEVPASAALDVIQEFLRAGRNDGLSVVLRFLSARRLRHPQHDVVVVLVEAVVRGRRIPLTGAASADDGVERASVLATLQATNAFVAGTLTADRGNGASAQ